MPKDRDPLEDIKRRKGDLRPEDIRRIEDRIKELEERKRMLDGAEERIASGSFLTKFDKKLDVMQKLGGRGGAPEGVYDAAVYVHDTLDLAVASAKTHFGEKVNPEVAIAIYELMNAERLRRTQGETSE